PDREGEAISWHVLNWLQQKNLIKDRTVQRVVFHEITKNAVRDAMAKPRDIDMDMVNAQQARRALDYLVGFNLSPVLWRKLPGSRSAGRVQSVALRLICARETEIEVFVPREYWTVEADMLKAGGSKLLARLTQLDGTKLDKFALPDRPRGEAAARRVREGKFTVATVERKQVKHNPNPPFITSTLQQEASRKLGFGARHTMQLAQRLYEGTDLGGETVGLITYMRTDSVVLSQTALDEARQLIARDFGERYRPEKARLFRSSAKNAQEAHEAIRPTSFERSPEAMRPYLEAEQLRLYELIWKRALASQMEHALLDQVGVDIANENKDVVLRTTGSVVAFDGFMRLYREDRDDPSDEDDDNERRLPDVKEGETLDVGEVRPDQHFTEPPPRYTEASLVKRMEELGIGRPSTYASIIGVLQDREYVVLDKKRFVPQDRGRFVTAFLESFFPNYVEYGFTAGLEQELDRISNGDLDWKQVLRDFWAAFHLAIEEASELERPHVLKALEGALEQHIFAKSGAGNPRICPKCDGGKLGLQLGKFGAFIGCSNYPDCRFTRQLAVGDGDDGAADDGPKHLGDDPETGLAVTLRRGPYGPYIQKGEPEGKTKPPRIAVPKGMSLGEIELEIALRLLSLPRDIGKHPEDGEPILAGIGRFGPYLKHGKGYVSIPKDDDVLSIGLNRAVVLIAEKAAKGPGQGRAAPPLKELGEHPDDQAAVEVKKGRYGPYVAHKRTFASLPKGVEPEDVTMEMALELLAKKLDSKKKKAPAKKAVPKKKAAAKKKAGAKKKAPAKKSAKAKKAAPESAPDASQED
ncbi:MAG: type I DNA topoisomerase, partial [Rhodospirillaceae bacterium]|nr:type I DNA topoisomerase [Rhodospirillaceae bacterium]